LSAGESVPTSLCWIIEDGYVLLTADNDDGHTTTLGIWGPGELVLPMLLGRPSVHLSALSAVKVQGWSATAEEEVHYLKQQLAQLATLLQLAHIRRAETRLHKLLLWLGERFGQTSSRGVSLSFNALNLTHRNLAEITGMTRVTVTKALIRFRQDGLLTKQGQDELLRRDDRPKGDQQSQ
jgi:CRP-like cAMP-binding protein